MHFYRVNILQHRGSLVFQPRGGYTFTGTSVFAGGVRGRLGKEAKLCLTLRSQSLPYPQQVTDRAEHDSAAA